MRDYSKPYYRKLGRDGKYQSLTYIEKSAGAGALTYKFVDGVVIPPSDDEIEAAMAERLANRAPTIIEQIEHYEEIARHYLAKAGMLAESVDSLAIKGMELTPEWHAAYALYYADLCKKHIHENCAVLAAETAMGLQYHTDYILISESEYSTLVGMKQLKAASGTRYTAADKREWERRRKELLQQDGKLNKPPSGRSIAKTIADITGHNFWTIQSHFKKLSTG